MIESFKQLIPILNYTSFKGDFGKVAVIGGSFEYTGAPYYTAMASLKGGGELAHIFCTPQAATPIKSYSPECIVHPLLVSSIEPSENIQQNVNSIIKWLSSMSAVVIGPGLGRDMLIFNYLPQIMSSNDKLTVLDADALWYFNQDENIRKIVKEKSSKIIMTPNKGEMDRICDLLQIKRTNQNYSDYKDGTQQVSIKNPFIQDAVLVSNALNNVIIVQKGIIDVITDGKVAYIVSEQGCSKRFGGQGDILCGLIATYSHWAFRSLSFIKLITGGLETILGCVMASYITRKSAYLAFNSKYLSVSCPDVLEQIGSTLLFQNMKVNL